MKTGSKLLGLRHHHIVIHTHLGNSVKYLRCFNNYKILTNTIINK